MEEQVKKVAVLNETWVDVNYLATYMKTNNVVDRDTFIEEYNPVKMSEYEGIIMVYHRSDQDSVPKRLLYESIFANLQIFTLEYRIYECERSIETKIVSSVTLSSRDQKISNELCNMIKAANKDNGIYELKVRKKVLMPDKSSIQWIVANEQLNVIITEVEDVTREIDINVERILKTMEQNRPLFIKKLRKIRPSDSILEYNTSLVDDRNKYNIIDVPRDVNKELINTIIDMLYDICMAIWVAMYQAIKNLITKLIDVIHENYNNRQNGGTV